MVLLCRQVPGMCLRISLWWQNCADGFSQQAHSSQRARGRRSAYLFYCRRFGSANLERIEALGVEAAG